MLARPAAGRCCALCSAQTPCLPHGLAREAATTGAAAEHPTSLLRGRRAFLRLHLSCASAPLPLAGGGRLPTGSCRPRRLPACCFLRRRCQRRFPRQRLPRTYRRPAHRASGPLLSSLGRRQCGQQLPEQHSFGLGASNSLGQAPASAGAAWSLPRRRRRPKGHPALLRCAQECGEMLRTPSRQWRQFILEGLPLPWRCPPEGGSRDSAAEPSAQDVAASAASSPPLLPAAPASSAAAAVVLRGLPLLSCLPRYQGLRLQLSSPLEWRRTLSSSSTVRGDARRLPLPTFRRRARPFPAPFQTEARL